MESKRRYKKPINRCPEHTEEELKFYCTAHNELICCICAVKKHKSCHDTLTFPEAVERFEHERNNLAKAFDSQSHMIQQAILESTSSLANVAPNARDIKKNILDLCQRIQRALKDKETNMLKSVDCLQKEQQESITKDMEFLQSLLLSASRIKESSERAFDKKNPLSIIKAMAKAQNAYCEIDRMAKTAVDRPKQSLTFQESATIQTFFESLEKLGEISISPVKRSFQITSPETTSPSSLPSSGFLSVGFASPECLETSYTTQGPQVTASLIDINSTSEDDEEDTSSLEEMSSFFETLTEKDSTELRSTGDTNIQEIVLQNEGKVLKTFLTVDHGKPCWLYGLAFLPDRRLVISDVAHDSLQMYDDTYNLLSERKVNFTPWDVAAMGDNMVAVCAGGKCTINIFSLHNNDFIHLRNLEVGIDCISLSFSKSVFTAGTRRGGILLSEEGEIMKRIEKNNGSKEFFRRADFLSTDDNRDNIFITNSWASKVVCVSSDGRQKWEFKTKGANPRGLVWNRGKLFVASRSHNKVISLDENDGKQEDVVTEGLECPYALAVHSASKILLISQWDEKMTAEKTRSIHIFNFQ